MLGDAVDAGWVRAVHEGRTGIVPTTHIEVATQVHDTLSTRVRAAAAGGGPGAGRQAPPAPRTAKAAHNYQVKHLFPPSMRRVQDVCLPLCQALIFFFLFSQRLNPDELSFEAGERLKIIKEAYDKGWFIAELIDGQQGLVPETHLIFEVRCFHHGSNLSIA